MKYLIRILILMSILFFTGCINLVEHVVYNEIGPIYDPTRIVYKDCICVWWNESSKLRPIESSLVEMTYLFWLVDFPCEIVLDTITLPYDLYRNNR